MRAVYLDTSAAVKLFKEEPESAALERWLSGQGSALSFTSDLTRAELRRALHAADAGPQALREAESWLHDCAIMRLTPALCDRAGDLAPGVQLRSLDALHIAAALSIMPALVGFVAYDDRLVRAANEAGLPVVSPA